MTAHRERAERWLAANGGNYTGELERTLAAEFEAVEAPLLARIAALEAAIQSARMLACKEGTTTFELAALLTDLYLERVTGEPTALKALLVRAAREGLLGGEPEGILSQGTQAYVAERSCAIAERILKEGRS